MKEYNRLMEELRAVRIGIQVLEGFAVYYVFFKPFIDYYLR